MGDELYNHLEEKRLLPDEQKGCRRKSRGTKDQVLIIIMIITIIMMMMMMIIISRTSPSLEKDI